MNGVIEATTQDTLDGKLELKKLTLKDGDTLIVNFKDNTPLETAIMHRIQKQIKDTIKEQIGLENIAVIVLHPSMTIEKADISALKEEWDRMNESTELSESLFDVNPIKMGEPDETL